MSVHSDEVIVKVEGVSKRFGAINALTNVSLSIRKGEIIGLAGHNGAGKSVLTKIMGGIYIPDEGKIFYGGQEVKLTSPKDAQERGFFVVPQELNLARQLSVADNIFIGQKEYANRLTGIVNKRYINDESRKLLKQYFNIDVDPSTPAGELDTVTQRIVQVVRCLRAGAKVIVFDETTAGLSQMEREKLFDHIRILSQKGLGIIFITHMISEIMDICHTVSALRGGEVIGTEKVENLTPAKVIEMIVGSEDHVFSSEKSSPKSHTLLSVKNLSTRDGRISNVNFDLRKGEILGIYGLRDQGQTLLLELIYGAAKRSSGDFEMDQEKLNIKSPIDALRKGISYLPERGLKSVFATKSIRENMLVQGLNFLKKGTPNHKKMDDKSIDESIRRINTRGYSSLENRITNLSGGNRQKILLARTMLLDPKVLMLLEPTQGIDIGAKNEIRQLILQAAKEDKAVIMATAEIDDIVGVCNRVAIIKEGKIKTIMDATEENRDRILEASS
ncbi:sugar ABC transporter ATP-binding protein [Paenibacillus abyssi]|uniref:Monosaccharide-transporting ATPase n=1 Tax=Paenibacillus abyssi TaxID=1340531 RepID=A0A917G137_9BACL|nr:sugar ABC transporter ATP-binding protein [Paenibacillus abyssi]GGG16788.1 monosaccharide-transporting ATPase [Paenibacillus abyssi]